MQKTIVLLCILIICSCGSNNEEVFIIEDSIVQKAPILLEKSLHDQEFSSVVGVINHNIVHDNDPIVTFSLGPRDSALRKVDSDTGEILWTWNDWYIDTEHAGFRSHYQFDDKILWVVGSRHYCVDLITGETVWRQRLDFSATEQMAGMDDNYYFIAQPQDTTVDMYSLMIYRGNVHTGEYTPFLNYSEIAPRSDPDSKILVGVVFVVPTNINGVNHLLITGRDADPNSVRVNKRHMSLYNLEEETWVYEKMQIGIIEGNNSGNVEIKDNRVFVAAGRHVESYDLLTGEQIWSTEFGHTFSFSGITVYGDRVIGNCENQELYIIDADTGRRIHTGEGSGTSSAIKERILNGVVYISGGGPNTLYAIDTNNSNTLWDISAKEYEGIDSKWKADIYVIPGEANSPGKVIIASLNNLYCFEAAR